MGTEKATSVKNSSEMEPGDILDLCRLCMEKCKNMKDLFAEEQSTIIAEVEFCIGLKLTQEEKLPSNVCNNCIHNLAIAFTFKTTCLTSDERFRTIVPKIKIEDTESDFCNHYDYEDCKDILKEELKLSDIEISRVQLNKEINGQDHKPTQKKRQTRLKQHLGSKKVKRQIMKKSLESTNKLNLLEPVKKLNKLHCEMCNIVFKTKEESTEHKKTKHKDTESFVCEICGKVFIHRASLYTHSLSHRPPRHACDKCDYKTGHKHDLVKHRRIHSGIKLYQCEFCTASYHTSSNLRCHIRLSHEGAPKRYQCRLCERGFFDTTKLRRHLDAHNDIKRYECSVCHSCFARRCYWKKHMCRQHGVIVPPTRPGRQKTNLVVDTQTDTPPGARPRGSPTAGLVGSHTETRRGNES